MELPILMNHKKSFVCYEEDFLVTRGHFNPRLFPFFSQYTCTHSKTSSKFMQLFTLILSLSLSLIHILNMIKSGDIYFKQNLMKKKKP